VTAADPQPAVADRRATVAFVAVVLLSVVVLFSPRTPSEQAVQHLDKLVHGSLFAVLAATTWWRFAAHRAGLLAVLAYAAASEVIQWLLIRGRDGDVRDVAADTVGALLGWVVVSRWARRER
jgi:VanZ family protein